MKVHHPRNGFPFETNASDLLPPGRPRLHCQIAIRTNGNTEVPAGADDLKFFHLSLIAEVFF